jgi:hypothetical protein
LSKKMFKKLLSLILVVTLMTFSAVPAFASQDRMLDISGSYGGEYYLSDISLSEADQLFLEKVVSVGDFYELDPITHELSISLTENELINEYGFTKDEYTRLMTDVIGTTFDFGQTRPDLIQPDAYVSGGTLYISYADLQVGTFTILVTAAAAGPAALAAAFTALASMLSGPVGTIVGVIAGLLALPSLTELCGRILFAVATGQGIYIKPVASYPPLEMGYW